MSPPGFQKYKIISITGQAGAGTDYQVELSIGDSAGGDFDLEGNCTNFPQDIIITDDDGETLLDYWIEDLTADPIIIHVNVADDLDSNQTIWVYYQKSGATTQSNIEATFLFGDDFPGTAIDTDKWYKSDDPTVAGGEAVLNNDDKIWSKTTFGYGYAVTSFAKANEQDVFFIRMHNSDGTVTNRLDILNSDSRSDNNFDRFDMYSDNAGTGHYTGFLDGQLDFRTDYRQYEIRRVDGEVTFYQDGNLLATENSSTYLPTPALSVGEGVLDSSQESTMWIKWIHVRKYNDPEPAFASAGVEHNVIPGRMVYQGKFNTYKFNSVEYILEDIDAFVPQIIIM